MIWTEAYQFLQEFYCSVGSFHSACTLKPILLAKLSPPFCPDTEVKNDPSDFLRLLLIFLQGFFSLFGRKGGRKREERIKIWRNADMY